jgi:PilZ domain.
MLNEARALRAGPAPEEPIEIQLEGFLDIFDARDISVTGIGVFVPRRLEGCHLRSPMDLVITLPAAEPFLASGRIVHRTKKEREFFGVEFMDLPSVRVREIADYVGQRLAEHGQTDSPEAFLRPFGARGLRAREGESLTLPEADLRLMSLLSELDGFRHELSQADQGGFSFVADEARCEIRRLHRRIRKHCEYHGLLLPSNVPECDE